MKFQTLQENRVPFWIFSLDRPKHPDPQSVYLCALWSQGRPPWQDSMMLGHASPVAHLSITIISVTSG